MRLTDHPSKENIGPTNSTRTNRPMSYSRLPLSYCTNVHPGVTVDEVCQGLRDKTANIQQRLGEPVAAGLWLAQPVIEELKDAEKLATLQATLREQELVCYTLNAFPYGNFHSNVVKQQVYIPDWTTSERLAYTQGCATILQQLLPAGVEGSLSTVPLGFKALATADDFIEKCISTLLKLVRFLDQLHDETGSVVRLAIEPEPLCVLETTPETITFFETFYTAAETMGLLAPAQRHIGVCYDVCHQAVEFEDVSASIQQLDAAGIRINKVHITCAIDVPEPFSAPEKLTALRNYIEPRYLHQTFARSKSGDVVSILDLNEELLDNPPEEFKSADCWRVHYHVPVNAESLGPLGTTRNDLRAALKQVGELDYAPHLEVETYTWSVMPGEAPLDLTEGLTEEMRATRALLAELG